MADDLKSGRGAPGRGGWWFLAAMLLLHLIVAWVDPPLSKASLARFVAIVKDIVPLFGLMFLLFWLFNLFVRPGRVVQQIGGISGIRGWTLSIGAGVFSMGPMYLWYPVLGQLRSEGLSPGLAAAFLYSRAIKIPMLPFMVHYFGAPYTAVFVVCILLFSVLGGVAMQRLGQAEAPH